jgi:hypothetical protein
MKTGKQHSKTSKLQKLKFLKYFDLKNKFEFKINKVSTYVLLKMLYFGLYITSCPITERTLTLRNPKNFNRCNTTYTNG